MTTQHILGRQSDSGFRNLEKVELTEGVNKLIAFNDDELFYGFKFLTASNIKVGTSETDIESLGTMEGEQGDIFVIGLVDIRTIYVQSSVNAELIPIIYKQNK